MDSRLPPAHMRSIHAPHAVCGKEYGDDVLPPIEFTGLASAAPERCCQTCLQIYIRLLDAMLDHASSVSSVRYLDGRD